MNRSQRVSRLPERSPRGAPSALTVLGRDVSRSLEAARGVSSATERVRAQLFASERPTLRHAPSPERSSPRVRVRLVALLAAALSVVGAIVFWPRPALTFSVGSGSNRVAGQLGTFLAAPATAPLPLSFSDDTTLALAPGSHARVFTLGTDGAHVGLERGSVDVHVVHRASTHWTLDAGPFAVQVTGTRFELSWDAATETMVVELKEGSVVVKGCGLGPNGQRVSAGQRLRASCSDRELAVAATATPTVTPPAPSPSTMPAHVEPVAAVEPADAAPPEPPPGRQSAPVSPRGAKQVDAAPPAPSKGAQAPSLELLWRAGEARYTHDFATAEALLREARVRFAGSDDAARAAFELGRIAFDVRHDSAEAAEWFERYLLERPNGELAREALGRAVETRMLTSDARARELASRYLATYPDGPHAALARKITSTTEQP